MALFPTLRVPVLATGLQRPNVALLPSQCLQQGCIGAWHGMRDPLSCMLPGAKHYVGWVLCVGVKRVALY